MKNLTSTIKPFLSDKTVGKNKIHLTENGAVIKTDLESTEILIFFQTQYKMLTCQITNITRYSNNKPFLDNVKDLTTKVILKYRNHPVIVAIKN